MAAVTFHLADGTARTLEAAPGASVMRTALENGVPGTVGECSIAIGEIAVPMLYDELPLLRSDDQRPATWSGWVFRGLTTLPVTWTPA